MGLSVGRGGVGGTNLNGGDDGLGGGGAKMLVCCRFSRVCGELWEDFPHGLPFFFDFHRDMFVVAWKREVVNVVEVFTNESVEVWERLRLGTYSQEGLVSESKKDVV